MESKQAQSSSSSSSSTSPLFVCGSPPPPFGFFFGFLITSAIIFSGLVFFIFFFGCKSEVSSEDITNLNGYWEIQEVTFSNGETKEFNVNPTIDYIEVKELKGLRKKVQPNFEGRYTATKDAEPFIIEERDGQFIFHYKNEMSEWREKIHAISRDNFTVINQDTLKYTYKRFQPVKLKK